MSAPNLADVRGLIARMVEVRGRLDVGEYVTLLEISATEFSDSGEKELAMDLMCLAGVLRALFPETMA